MSEDRTAIHVLLVEDDPNQAHHLSQMVSSLETDLQFTHTTSLADAIAYLASNHVDVMLLDLSLPDSQDLDPLLKVSQHSPAVPIIVLTDREDNDLAARLLQEGAQDYLVKSQVTSHMLLRSMRYAIDRKRNLDALRESEMRYRTLVEHMPAVTYLAALDDTSSTIFISPQIEQLLGFTQEEWMADRELWLKQIHPDDHEHVLASLVLTRQQGVPHSAEYRVLTREGHIRWVQDTGAVVYDANGKPLFLQGMWLDITQRKEFEDSLRESEARYRILVEKLPMTVYELDRDGRVLSINQTGLQMLGKHDEEEVRGLAYQEVFRPEEMGYLGALLARAYAGEELQIDATATTNNTQRVFTTTLTPQRNSNGVVTKLVGTMQDITDQLHMRLEAEQDRDRLDAILESTNDAIIMIGLDGQIALVNRAFSIFFGVEPDDVIDTPASSLITDRWSHIEPQQLFQSTVEELLIDQQREDSGEVTLLRPTKRILVWYSGPVRTRASTILGRLFIFRDATLEKEAELMKAEFISIVSHELRTPLTSIKGFTDLILDGDVGEINDKLREFLEIVKLSTDQLVEITDDILEASRIESGRIKLELQPVQIDEVINSVVLSMQMMIQAKSQTIEIDLPDDLPEALADRERLAQIFTNLLSNAHKYTPQGGYIRVTAEVVERARDAHVVQPDRNGPWMLIRVIDNGIGISPEDQQHMFTRFYRVSSVETQGIGGTGLGLHISRSLVELQGGAIWIESELGKGSTFLFSLPIAKAQADSAEQSEDDAERTRRQILLIEPQASEASALLDLLETEGFEVLLVDQGQAALAHAHLEPPALFLLSSQLPDMDITAFLSHMQADTQLASVPVVLILEEGDVGRAVEPGVSYVTRPIDRRALLDVIHAALDQDQRSVALVIDDDHATLQTLSALLIKRGYNTFVATTGQQGLMLAKQLRPSLVVLDLWMPELNGFQVLNVLRQHPLTRTIPVIALNDSDIAAAALRRVLMLEAVDLISKPEDNQVLERMVATRLDLLALTAQAT